MIRIVTDSSSQIPPELAERFGITVVPVTVTIDGVDHLEGVDLDVEDFYARFHGGRPAVKTAQPSPGSFADVYRRLLADGAEEILSVHIGSAVSGTVNSARVAARTVDLPVRIVDTGSASFAVALCAWAAAEAAASGATVEEAAAVAEATAAAAGNVFVVGALDLARAGGRLAADALAETPGIPVMTMVDGTMQVLGQATDYEQVADVMASHIVAGGHDLRVGIGVADAGVLHLWDVLEQRLAGAPEVREVVRYRVGPSVGAHTGPGTVGAMFAPTPVPTSGIGPPPTRPGAG